MSDQTALTAARFKTKFGADLYGDLTDSQITSFIEIACEIGGDIGYNALCYLTAHLIVLENKERQDEVDGGSGEVTSESFGGKSLGYQSMASDQRDVFFTRTYYGRMYLQLQRRSPVRAIGMFVR